jgi:hypothetical protein
MSAIDEAKEKLWKAQVAVDQGKLIDAMRAVGMTFEWLEELTMTEATEIFQMRVHDLMQMVNESHQ